MTFLRRFGTSRYLSTSHKSTAKSLVSRLQENKELDLEDARNELRWIRQSLPAGKEQELANLVDRRSRGEPLQYILGTLPTDHYVELMRKAQQTLAL
jgi:methylase of polypeptide subunit release factors